MIRTAREIAEFIGAQIEGDPAAKVSGVASPEAAGPEDVIYADSARHLDRAAQSRARCVLLPPGLDLAGRTILRSAQPKLAFAKAAAWLLPSPPITSSIHPTAIVAPTAKLGEGVGVGPYVVIEDDVEIGDGAQLGAHCSVGRGARIGERCRLYPRVTLYAGVRLGKNVIVHSGTVIGSDGFGYVFGEGRHWKFPQIGGVEIGDDVEIGSNTSIDRGALDTTRIGAGTKIDNLVQVAHNVQIGEHSIIAAQTGISGSSHIGNNVLIGGQVGIADGCHIRDAAIVGAQAGIPTGKTIPAGQTVWGTPARPLARFKEQYAWFARLPELAERLKKLEQQRL
ncbi:MAG: UDP-3-O-(3-hydroxymyristoyl)glucosamine N-acyltransferase [Acidobacteria bacterium]|nr:UDP-3-O-(3-hydroxymyristoyl)glucosamine N-acyltransferase [Acidobacteriota bacterium]MBI3663314.1 UDP-3-O-(3-hydroxymyristoyl)glucosamine N-acyltransferase [Acidobacteriota bacterium]